MNLKKNILANYISQIYVTIIGMVFLPLYIKYMGSESYGLVAFFTMLQAWFNVLDLGLSPTIGRETSRYKGGSSSPLAFSQLFRALNIIFIIVAFIGGTMLFLAAEIITLNWLNIESLTKNEVLISIQIMAVCVALRWMCGLYRGVIIGSENLVWLSVFSSVIATLRFVGVFVTMFVFGFTPLVFFSYQLFVAFIEIVGILLKTKKLLPNSKELIDKIGWSLRPIKPVLKFSLSIAFTSSVWVFITQTDKLILSGILPLESYGYFTLSVLVANGIMMVSGPISSAVMPRMSRLFAEKKHDEMITVYRQSTRLASIIAGSVAITLIVVAKPLLLAWTGEKYLADQVTPILRLYAAGNCFLVMAAFSYYLQYAKGVLKYHLIGNVVMVIVLIPSIIFGATYYGGIGAGYVWLSINILFFVFWVAYIHYKLCPGLHLKWLFNDVIKIIFPVVTMAILLQQVKINLVGRVENLIYVLIISALLLSVACLSKYFFKAKSYK